MYCFLVYGGMYINADKCVKTHIHLKLFLKNVLVASIPLSEFRIRFYEKYNSIIYFHVIKKSLDEIISEAEKNSENFHKQFLED